jgi:hypothetical protein
VDAFCGDDGSDVLTFCEGCRRAIPRVNFLSDKREPNVFCVGCGNPYPWATREQLVDVLQDALDQQRDLSPTLRKRLSQDIDALIEPEDADTVPARIRLLEGLRDQAPMLWAMRQPILVNLISAGVMQQLHMHG